jgi:FkbM family methyltransferase
MYSLKELQNYSKMRTWSSNLLIHVLPKITRKIWKRSGQSQRHDYVDSELYKKILAIHSRLLLLPNTSEKNIKAKFDKHCVLQLSTSRLTDTLALVFGTGEFDVAAAYKLIQDKDDIILDIGANIGTTSIHFANQNPSAVIHSFEPNKIIYDVLRNNIHLSTLDNIKTYNFGLGNSNETLYLEIQFEGNPGSAQISDAPGLNPVLIKKLDELDEITKFSMIKMDVEGYELQVLLGGLNKISKNRPKMILEFFNGFELENSDRNNQLIELLLSMGYHLYLMNGKLIHADAGLLLSTRKLLNLVALPDPYSN